MHKIVDFVFSASLIGRWRQQHSEAFVLGSFPSMNDNSYWKMHVDPKGWNMMGKSDNEREI
jgi:hypothetical protein